MRKEFSVFLLSVCLVVSTTSFAIGQATQTVVATGLGKDIESAAKNAAEQALMQVVSTFIDAEKLLQKNVEIKAGIRSETKNLSTRISQYSQGVIESLEVLSVDQVDGLYRVEARVAVRIEDFKYYIRESVLAERKVQQGLLAQIKVKEDQEQGAAELLGKIFRDAKSYSVVVPRVGEIEAVEDPSLVQELERQLPGPGYLIRIPVTARLSDDFLTNALRVFDETAEQRYRGAAFNNAGQSFFRSGVHAFLVYVGDFFTVMAAGASRTWEYVFPPKEISREHPLSALSFV